LTRRYVALIWGLLLIILLVACQGESDPADAYDPADLLFTGDVALDIVEAITGNFPDRASEEINNELAAEWLDAIMTQLGWQCISDEWEVVNYSHDQSPGTIEGADSNASGVAVMLLLAQILAAEQPWPYTMILAATDGQAYGLLGAQRLIGTHPDPERIIAAVSLNNLGLDLYEGLGMAATGLSEGYGPLWLQQTTQVAARAAGDLWVPQTQSELQQTYAQALPFTMTDQGPFVAAGVPALGLFGLLADEDRDQVRELHNSPADTFERQSADTLTQSGRVAEALIRQLQGMVEFPENFAPYLVYDGGQQLVPPYVFYLIAFALAGLFFLASYLSGRRLESGYLGAVLTSLPHFLSLWLPFIASILLLYFFVIIGLLDEFDTYPATPKDPELMNPRWFIIIIWLIALWEFLQIGRRLEARYVEYRARPVFGQIRAIVFLVVGLALLVALIMNPVSALAFLPVIAWLFIGNRHGRRRGIGKYLDIVLFLVGGLFIYMLIHFIGDSIVAVRLLALWYLLLGISVQMIDFVSAAMIFAVLAAGLALLVNPPFDDRDAKDEPADDLTGSPTAPVSDEPDAGDENVDDADAPPLAASEGAAQ